MPWRFLVIDGYDQGAVYPLPPKGIVTVGNKRKEVDIVLHDLLTAPVHCEVELDGDRVAVAQRDMAKAHGTFVNGIRIERQELHLGDVLRVGNSYLRLESAEPTPEPLPPKEDEPLPQLGPERLEQLTGHLLGHHLVGPLLGKGHAGMVFRAHDRKADRVVALKVLSPLFPKNDAEMQGFVRALKAGLPLRHFNLVTLYGAGRTGGYCWIAQEYVEGESLAQVVQRVKEAQRIDWTRACRVAVHIARALDYTRRYHITHGNITPQNIMIQGEGNVAKLGDLMLVKALEDSELQKATLENKVLSELAYLSPEQVVPDAFVDDLVDLYSLGTIVYALLAGRPPFPGDSPEEILERIQEGEVDKPSRYQRGIPEAFEKVVMRMLAKHQENRYSSPAEVLAEVEAIAAEHEVDV
jgi:hypothetical protein